MIIKEGTYGYCRSHETTRAGSSSNSFASVLHATGPDAERKSKLALYAFLVGHWEIDVTTIDEDKTTHSGRGDIHAGWVLRGRAIQDVWMIPRLIDRKPGIEQLAGAGNWYGTTLRSLRSGDGRLAHSVE